LALKPTARDLFHSQRPILWLVGYTGQLLGRSQPNRDSWSRWGSRSPGGLPSARPAAGTIHSDSRTHHSV